MYLLHSVKPIGGAVYCGSKDAALDFCCLCVLCKDSEVSTFIPGWSGKESLKVCACMRRIVLVESRTYSICSPGSLGVALESQVLLKRETAI